MYLFSPRNKNPKGHISYLLEKVVFVDPKRLLSPLGKGEEIFFFNLNIMISQMVRNGSVRFGRHIDIEVSYKILRLEVPKMVPNFTLFGLLSKGAVWRQFCAKKPLVL
jgi:hypothetical protein